VTPELTFRPDAVPLGLLRRYLLANGWRQDGSTGRMDRTDGVQLDRGIRDQFLLRATTARNVDLFVHSEPNSEDIEVLVPRDQSGADFESRVQSVVRIVSEVEDRRPEQVLIAIRSIGYDLIQSRIPDALVVNDAVELERARSYVNSIKDLLAATATSELRPLAFFGRVNKEAIQYSDRCRFGHTYKGSFGFTIESPVSSNVTAPLFENLALPPFERRVVQRLATGIDHLCEAVRIDDPKPVIDGFKSGLNANGCEQFAALVHQTAYSGMTFEFEFSSEWVLPAALKRRSEFFVGPRHVEIARAAAHSLRGESIELPITLSGKVVRLQNEADPSDLSSQMGEGEIAVLYSSDIYGDIHVRTSLSPPEYLKAVEAHRLGRAVRIDGILAHRGRYWYLLNPTQIIVQVQAELDLE
jgi:hypothetical protein